jgi:hypothetical protein
MYYSRYFEGTHHPIAEADSIMSRFAGASGYDPANDLRNSSAVGLYLLGGLDRSVPTAQSVCRIRQVDAVAPGRLTVLVLPTGDHSLVDARTGTALPFANELVAWLHRAGVRDFSD